MITPDVNVLVYAYRTDTELHDRYQRWLEDLVNGDAAYGVFDVVLSGFVRVVTNPRIFQKPDPVRDAMEFASILRDRSNCVVLVPGRRSWEIFDSLCRSSGVKGNRIADAYLAALALEAGVEWATADRGFARFPGLRWRHPLSE